MRVIYSMAVSMDGSSPDRTELELAETRTFGSRVVYLRYRRMRDADITAASSDPA